jgi:hypothetical protein
MNNERGGETFPTANEEIQSLIKELHNLRAEVRDVSSKLSRIERRVVNAFPNAMKHERKMKGPSPEPQALQHSTMSSEQIRDLYDELVGVARNAGESALMDRIGNIADWDLRLMVQELGISLGKKKPSRPILQSNLIQRIKESLMLTRHVNLSAKRNEQDTSQ